MHCQYFQRIFCTFFFIPHRIIKKERISTMATFYNQATLSYNGNTTTSNITTGELVEVLSATKTAVQAEYQQDDTLTYVVNILNSGNTTMTGVTISDNLGAYTLNALTLVPMDYVIGTVRYYVGGVLQPTPTVTAGPPLTISCRSQQKAMSPSSTRLRPTIMLHWHRSPVSPTQRPSMPTILPIRSRQVLQSMLTASRCSASASP